MFKNIFTKLGLTKEAAPQKPVAAQPVRSETFLAMEQVVRSTYSPYGTQVLDKNFPITFDNEQASPNGWLYFDLADGHPTEIKIGNFSNNAYSSAHVLEHEGVHLNQYDYPIKHRYMNIILPQHAHKFTRLVELEAYGRQAYKLIKDYADGAIGLDRDMEIALGGSLTTVFSFVGAYKGKDIDPTLDSLIHEFNVIKDSGKIKPVEEVLPEFYYQRSGNKEWMNKVLEPQLDIQDRIFSDFVNYQPHQINEYLKTNVIKDTDRIKDFTLEMANNFLGRDGSNPIKSLPYKKQEAFWRNMNMLDKPQRLQVESYKQKIAACDI